jgi:16S rRNA G966 N2-methylase RsmD
VDFLRGAGTADAGSCAAGLEQASRGAAQDLSGAAASALALLEGPAPALRSELQTEEFARRREHLTAICRIILGR